MTELVENLITRLWNWGATPKRRKYDLGGLTLGTLVRDGVVTNQRVSIPQNKRPEHIAIEGRTGMGKSYLMRHFIEQDVEGSRGFLLVEMHNDLTPYVLRLIAEQEARTGSDLSDRLIVIEPSDPYYSVGFNPLESSERGDVFLQIAEFTEILKQRWKLDTFGARTEELLRNALHVIAENQLTLVEIAPLLTSSTFRQMCLKAVRHPAVREYFENRYDTQGEAMQAAMRDPILNKVSAFTVDPKFRHLLGQQTSTFSLLDAMDKGLWVIVNLDKGKLGEHAATLGALLLARVKNALFARRNRSLFTIYADEIQNLTAIDSGIESVLSESRKFGVSICSSNQFLEQFSAQMRAAILSIGTHICFQLSSADAEKFAAAFDGGKRLAELLRNLPKRQMVVKSGDHPYIHAEVSAVREIKADFRDLANRSRKRFARSRTDIEAAISARQKPFMPKDKEALHEWE